jgi:tryptophan-rich sensory protein
MNKILKLIISIALPLLVGFTASLFTRPEIEGWYRALQRPEWNPPDWLFAPVWTSLYILMGVACYLIWIKAPSAQRRDAMVLYFVQLALNFTWSFLFFRMHQPGSAFAEIILLWLCILLTIFAFARLNRLAAWLLVPYISWVSFAAILNYTIWQLN